MRVDHRLLRAGVFLVLLGVPALLVQAGAIEAAALDGAPRFWPLVLIAIGVGVLLRFTPLASLGGVLVAGTLGLLIGTAVAAGTPFLGGCVGGSSDAAAPLEPYQGSFSGDGARVDLSVDCGDLEVSMKPGSDWEVRTDNGGRGAANIRGTGTELTARSRDGGRFVFSGDVRARWEVALPTGPRIDLEVAINAGSGRLRLGGARLGTVELDVNAGSGSIDLAGATLERLSATANAGNLSVLLGPGSNLTGEIDVNAGNLDLCIPAGVGIELVAREALGNNDFSDRGLVRSGNTWRSADYDTAPSRVRLQLSTNVGNASLNPEGGCDG